MSGKSIHLYRLALAFVEVSYSNVMAHLWCVRFAELL